MMQPNTFQLWDYVWEKPLSAEAHRYACAVEEHTVRWHRMEALIQKEFGGFDKLRVIEIGAGAGTNAALMAARGARVTVLDYSERALARAQDLFAAMGVRTDLVQANALALPPRVLGQFDVSMSFGLNEHFTGAERVQIFQAHLDLLRADGMSFISVPNAYNPPYRAFKWLAETTKRWKLGVEIPFTRAELEQICKQLGVREYDFFGDSLLTSFQFVNPWRYVRKRIAPQRTFDTARVGWEHGTPLDERWSYATVLVIKR